MITQRRVTIGIGAFIGFAALIYALTEIPNRGFSAPAVSSLISSAIMLALTFAYMRGWEFGRNMIASAMLLIIVATTREPFLTDRFSLGLLLPPIVTLLVTSPRWMILSALVLYGAWGSTRIRSM